MLFSANTQLSLRAHKKYVISTVESLLPPSFGCTVLAMEVSCNLPLCAPLETCVVLVKDGEGKVTFKIMKPMKDVTLDDVRGRMPRGLGGDYDPVKDLEDIWNLAEARVAGMPGDAERREALEWIGGKVEEYRREVGGGEGGEKGSGGGEKGLGGEKNKNNGNFVIKRSGGKVVGIVGGEGRGADGGVAATSKGGADGGMAFSANKSKERSKIESMMKGAGNGGSNMPPTSEEREVRKGRDGGRKGERW